MENSNFNKSMCEEIFGGKLGVTEKTPEPFESDKFQVRQNERELEALKKVEVALEKMDSFSRRIPSSTSIPSSTFGEAGWSKSLKKQRN